MWDTTNRARWEEGKPEQQLGFNDLVVTPLGRDYARNIVAPSRHDWVWPPTISLSAVTVT